MFPITTVHSNTIVVCVLIYLNSIYEYIVHLCALFSIFLVCVKKLKEEDVDVHCTEEMLFLPIVE